MKPIALLSISMMLVALPAAAQTDLSRPDPGIGKGFAQMMAEQFQEHFGIDQERADCLVYEVTVHGRENGYNGTPIEMAEQVRDQCDA